MTPCPRPAPREPKPRKRIARRAKPRSRMPGRLADGLARRKALVEEADELRRKCVELMRGPMCNAGCGRFKARGWVMQDHHIFGRTLWPARWAIENSAYLCEGCHQRVQRDHEANRELGIRLMGKVTYDAMNVSAHSGARTDPAMAIVVLKAQLARLRDRKLGGERRNSQKTSNEL